METPLADDVVIAQEKDDSMWFMMVEVQNHLDTWEGL